MMWEILWGFEPALITGFVIAGLILNLTPGADFLFIMSSGLSGGPRIGVAAALGVNLGVVVHILAAAAGLSALLLAHPAAYDAIRISGAAYLAWMALQAWRSSDVVVRARGSRGVWQAARRGFFINVSNPKTALFIFAFIPQFTDPAVGPIWVADLDPWNNIFGEWGVVHALPWWRVWLFRGGAGRARWRSEQNICNFTRRAGSPFDH